jgi:hypothetical protein
VKKLSAIILFVLLLLSVVVTPQVANAFSHSCDRFASCGGPADCTWWGAHCAASDPLAFMEITGIWW